jgi:hypothetical protein
MREAKEMLDLHDAAVGAGGGVLAAVLSWLLGRSDTAKERRENEIRRVAEKVVTEARVEIRLNTIETLLPEIRQGVQDTKESVRDLNDKFDRFLLKD